jgi:hypothetical protein
VKAGPILAMIMITGYVIELPYGPRGVALAYSAVLTLWVIPHILWCVRGTPISLRDVLLAVSRPLCSAILAAALALEVQLICGWFVSPFPRLILETAVLLVTFFGLLLFAAGQKSLYMGLLREFKGPSNAAETISASA